MAFLDKTWEGCGPQILLGVGLGLAAPILLAAVASAARPFAKALMKSYFALADIVKEAAEEAARESAVEVAEEVALEVAEALVEGAG